jgi:DNA-binding transcriptional LysR family regulator
MKHSDPNWFLRARLKTKQLLLLIALDEERNIHRAANELSMTQPAASKQLKDLESMLGVSLFDRLPRGMQPTIYGETMIRHARMALTSLAQAHDDIRSLKSGLSGEVDVGVILTPSISLIPQAIARIKKQAPMLRIGLQVESSNVLMSRLMHGELDFMIARIRDDESNEHLLYEELSDESICAVTGIHHPLVNNLTLSMEEIAAYPWICSPKGSILRQRCDQMFYSAGVSPPDNVIETTSTLIITNLLAQSDAICAMPTEIAAYYAQANLLRILPITLPCSMDGFGIVQRRNDILSPSATLLIDTLRDIAKSMYLPPKMSLVA